MTKTAPLDYEAVLRRGPGAFVDEADAETLDFSLALLHRVHDLLADAKGQGYPITGFVMGESLYIKFIACLNILHIKIDRPTISSQDMLGGYPLSLIPDSDADLQVIASPAALRASRWSKL